MPAAPQFYVVKYEDQLKRLGLFLKDYLVRTTTLRSAFLFGVAAGVILQLPYIRWLERTPAIIAEPIPDSIYNKTTKRTYTIRNIPAILPFVHNTNLRITVASSREVNEEARKRYSLSKDDELAGFYDPIEHEIWSVNDIGTLVHEVRHVFEGAFHRNLLLIVLRGYL